MKLSLQDSNQLRNYFLVGALMILAMKGIHLASTQAAHSAFNVMLNLS